MDWNVLLCCQPDTILVDCWVPTHQIQHLVASLTYDTFIVPLKPKPIICCYLCHQFGFTLKSAIFFSFMICQCFSNSPSLSFDICAETSSGKPEDKPSVSGRCSFSQRSQKMQKSKCVCVGKCDCLSPFWLSACQLNTFVVSDIIDLTITLSGM